MPLQDKHFKEGMGSTDKIAHWCFKPLLRCTENAVVGENLVTVPAKGQLVEFCIWESLSAFVRRFLLIVEDRQ